MIRNKRLNEYIRYSLLNEKIIQSIRKKSAVLADFELFIFKNYFVLMVQPMAFVSEVCMSRPFFSASIASSKKRSFT